MALGLILRFFWNIGMVDTVDTARGLKFSDGAPDFHFTSRLGVDFY